MEIKQVGLILGLIGIIGAISSLVIMVLIQPCCILFMETYHQMLLILIPIFIVVLVIGVYLYFKKEKVVKVFKATKIERILTPDERRVIEFLKGKKSVTQAEIRKGLDMPRATLSMLLSKMEKRKLIKKEKIGKTNVVVPMKGF